jgi:polyphosphate kinase
MSDGAENASTRTSSPSLLRTSDGASSSSSAPNPLFINRELSWLEFNQRVLEEAGDNNVPLIERLKFLAIVSSNLDEFFMIRVAGLKQQLAGELDEPAADGLTVVEQLASISQRVHRMVADQYQVFREQVRPKLEHAGLVIAAPDAWTPDELRSLNDHFLKEVFPVLTPLAIDPGHPFPRIKNKTLYLSVTFDEAHDAATPSYAVLQVPTTSMRLVELRRNGVQKRYALLEDVIAKNVGELFPGLRVSSVSPFRVTRNWDLELDEEEAEDLLEAIQQELRRRDRGNAVRVEVAQGMNQGFLELVREKLKLERDDVYEVDGPIHLGDLLAMAGPDLAPDLRDPPATPQVAAPFRDVDDLFSVIAERDVVLQHPYDSFDSVVEFVSRAADDPKVLAIKQTLYRAGQNSPFVRALARAAEMGKQVTALVELKARFDEENNIQWARTLEESGVHVVYGLIGLKTHAKVCLVVRREATGLRRYVHLSTGNYNASTARLYTDVTFFTARPEFGEDANSLFNLLTGYSAPARWKRLIVAPLGLHESLLALIHREAEHARAGRPARIVAKMNSLVDPDVIDALYSASQMGVQVDLIIRGICCLRPGMPGVSDRIRVFSIVDRFLEHARITMFDNGGAPEVYLASADWMPRNFQRRVEVMWPIEDKSLAGLIRDEILATMLADNVKARLMRPDGYYERRPVAEGEPVIRSQQRFLELSRERAKASRMTAASGSPFRLRAAASRGRRDEAADEGAPSIGTAIGADSSIDHDGHEARTKKKKRK